MNAGRELDALVAEKVMGWTEVRMDTWHQRGNWFGRNPTANGRQMTVPRFSTGIAAAWDVVRQMHDVHDFWMSLEYEGPEMGSVEFRMTDGPYFRASTSTAMPHTICLAALACVGVMLPGAEQTYPVRS